MFGAGTSGLTSALSYIDANGGGTLVVSSQSTAAAAILDTDADVAGIGGFSGQESEVTTAWLAQAVGSGKVRWVLASDTGGGGMGGDGRTGSRTVMSAVTASCAATAVDGLYDCSAAGAALAAA